MISNTTTSYEWTVDRRQEAKGQNIYTVRVFTPETLPVEKRSFTDLNKAYKAAFKAGLQEEREI